MKIKAIELISEKEWKEFREINNVITEGLSWWWLRDRSAASSTYFRFVYDTGDINSYGAAYTGIWLRPAVRVESHLHFKLGQIVYLEYINKLLPFVCVKQNKIGDYILLSNSNIKQMQIDSECEDYEESDARAYLHSIKENFTGSFQLLFPCGEHSIPQITIGTPEEELYK